MLSGDKTASRGKEIRVHKVIVLAHTEIGVSDLVDSLKADSIVVVNSIDRDRAHILRDETTLALKDWSGTGPDVYYNEFEISVDDQRWWAPTLTHSDGNIFELSEIQKLVQRAMEIWIAKGCPHHFVHSNTAPRARKTDAALDH
jgi:hypothetical protein